MILLFIVLSMFLTNITSQNDVNDFPEKDSKEQETANAKLKAYFGISSERPYEIIISKAVKDTTINDTTIIGIGNYQIRDPQNIYFKGCCVGNVRYENKETKSELYLNFNKKYQFLIQYYYYNDISIAYERNKYVKFTTPPYDEKIKSFFIEVKFNNAGGVSISLDNQY